MSSYEPADLPALALGSLLFFLLFSALGQAQAPYKQTRTTELVPAHNCDAVDGDTIDCDGEFIRILGIDTPELFSARCDRERLLAQAAAGRLNQLLRRREVYVERLPELDRYRRSLARVFAGRDNVAVVLIREGHARPYICEKGRCPRREGWCPAS